MTWCGGESVSWIHVLSTVSAAVIQRPPSLLLHYDKSPPDTQEWRCMCAFATCTQRSADETIFGRRVPWAAHRSDLMRLSVLQEQGGAYSDHDTFMLAPLSTLRRCPRAPLVAGLERFTRTTSKLNNGMMLASLFRCTEPS